MPGTEHIRYFFALPVAAPAPARALLDRLGEFSPQVKPVDPNALHLTLRFIGPARRERVTTLGDALERAVTQAAIGPIELHWRPPRFFPHPTPRRARTIVLPPHAPETSPLHRLEAALSDELERLNPPIERDTRGFHPHLTLARLKKQRSKTRMPVDALESTVTRYAKTTFNPATLDRVALWQSTLTPQGPHYEPMRQVNLR